MFNFGGSVCQFLGWLSSGCVSVGNILLRIYSGFMWLFGHLDGILEGWLIVFFGFGIFTAKWMTQCTFSMSKKHGTGTWTFLIF